MHHALRAYTPRRDRFRRGPGSVPILAPPSCRRLFDVRLIRFLPRRFRRLLAIVRQTRIGIRKIGAPSMRTAPLEIIARVSSLPVMVGLGSGEIPVACADLRWPCGSKFA